VLHSVNPDKVGRKMRKILHLEESTSHKGTGGGGGGSGGGEEQLPDPQDPPSTDSQYFY